MDKALKILFVLPIYGGSLPIGQYCVEALKNLGHIVDVFEADRFQEAQHAFSSLKIANARADFLKNSFANLLSEAVYAKAERFEPDIVFSMAQAPLTAAVLRRFKKDNILTAMWFVEDHKIFTYWRAYANLYNFFFVIQKEPLLSLLKENGHENAHYLPLAALPSFHKKQELTAEEEKKYGADVSFLGAGYTNRRYEFKKLIQQKSFKIWGSDWEDEITLLPFIQNNGKRIDPESSVKIYSATKINLNLHSSVIHNKEEIGDFVNPRTFELASIGAFQLVDKRTLMPELFEMEGENKELITFTSFDEVPELLHYYLSRQEEREEVAQRALKRVHKDHTYQQRMQQALDIIIPQLPARKEKDLSHLEGLEDIDKEELKALYEKLQLPLSADFDDIIFALRKENKSLDGLETSLLFLDEWRKQYGKQV